MAKEVPFYYNAKARYHTAHDGSLSGRNKNLGLPKPRGKVSSYAQRRGLLVTPAMLGGGAVSRYPVNLPYLGEPEVAVIEDVLESNLWINRVAQEDPAEQQPANGIQRHSYRKGKTATSVESF